MTSDLKHEHLFEECTIPLPHVGPCENRDLGGWVDWNDVPKEPWNEIIPRLYVGGSLVAHPTEHDFDTVLTLWHRADPCGSDITELRWHFPDLEMPDVQVLDYWAAAVLRRHQLGERILVRCQAGLNRSSLVVATVLMMKGYSPTEAIDLIRANRSKYALCNSKFSDYIMSQEV